MTPEPIRNSPVELDNENGGRPIDTTTTASVPQLFTILALVGVGSLKDFRLGVVQQTLLKAKAIAVKLWGVDSLPLCSQILTYLETTRLSYVHGQIEPLIVSR